MRVRQSRQLKARFLDAFRRHGNVSWAVREAGIPHRTVIYAWRDRDEAFGRAFEEAEQEATERMEQAAYTRAVDGVVQTRPIVARGAVIASITTTEYSDSLLMFMLKARAPEKYRDRHEVRHGGSVEHISLDGARRLLRVVGGND